MSLLTLAEIKAFLQITTTASDPILNLYNSYVCDEVEAYVDRNLAEATYTDEVLKFERSDNTLHQDVALNETFNNPLLFLKNTPARTLTLKEGDVTVPTTDYRLIGDEGAIETYRGLDDSKSNLTATYTAGYTLTTGTEYSVPDNLKLVAQLGVRSMWENGGVSKENSGDVKSKKVGDFSVTYGNNQTGYISASLAGLVKVYLESNSVILNRYVKIDL